MTRSGDISVNRERTRLLNDKSYGGGPVVYWMSRDQRVSDNWALIFAAELAVKLGTMPVVVFCLTDKFQGACLRHYDFMVRGLEEAERKLAARNISFNLITGNPGESLPAFIEQTGAGALVGEFDPLKIKKKWKQEVLEKIRIPFHEVDAHNIVPCIIASGKQEFGAYTLRPKIGRLTDRFLDDFPELPSFEKRSDSVAGKAADREGIKKRLFAGLSNDAGPVNWLEPGEDAALRMFRNFLTGRLHLYGEKRNDPNENAVSDMSPYLHFGHISAQRMALEILKAYPKDPNPDAFLEELIIRRELSDNFCHYNTDYDSFKGFPAWAQKTLNEHRKDEREYLYDTEQFETGQTHDSLWNAAQMEMVNRGKMHGYMRMYWAKKILEWTPSPEVALETAIYLNDKYELDGRDPNGYAGCAWSIGGVHDRAWAERPVYGKIRYMNANGCRRKFDADTYIRNNQDTSN